MERAFTVDYSPEREASPKAQRTKVEEKSSGLVSLSQVNMTGQQQHPPFHRPDVVHAGSLSMHNRDTEVCVMAKITSAAMGKQCFYSQNSPVTVYL